MILELFTTTTMTGTTYYCMVNGNKFIVLDGCNYGQADIAKEIVRLTLIAHGHKVPDYFSELTWKMG